MWRSADLRHTITFLVYLSDRDIRQLLPQLDLTTDSARPFDPRTQIQPCSIDLRISNVFWKPIRRRRLWKRALLRRDTAIDLRRSRVQDLDRVRDWRRVELADGETVTIKPGGVLMGRVYERFRVPPTHAGKLEGRSSFARLGLAIHCSADFINPGWSGFMPLQLFNAGPHAIRITPYLPICQLMLVPLSQPPERSYGDPDLQSKYENDDGGPSMWWRDSRVRDVQARLGETHMDERIVAEVVNMVRFKEPDILERFEQFVGDQRVASLSNGDEVLQGFAAKEDRLRLRDGMALGALGILIGGLIGSVFVTFGVLHALLLIAVLVDVPLAWDAHVRRGSGYLGRRELHDASARPAASAS